MLNSAENLREFTRIQMPVNVRILSPGHETITCQTRDLALNGVLLSSAHVLPLGSACEVRIQLEEAGSIEIVAFGKVVRADQQGMAVGFDSLDVEGYTHMKNLLMYNAGNSDAIEHEVKSHLGLLPR